jgi:two-component sensor histidine kinase
VLFFSCGASSITAQTIVNYTTDNLLSTNTIYGIFKLKNGSILLCTNEGLLQYTGKDVHPYAYLNPEDEIKDEVFDIYEDEHGRMWLSTFKATLAFIQNHYYHSARNDTSLVRPVQLTSNLRTLDDKKHKNVIIYSTGIDTIYKYDGQSLSTLMLTPKDFVHFSFDIDRNANFVFYGNDRKVTLADTKKNEERFDNKVDKVLCKHLQCHKYTVTPTHLLIDDYRIPQPKQIIKPGPINSIIYDSLTQLLYVCCTPGLIIYDTKKKTTKAYLLEQYTVSDVCALQNGKLLASTTENGLFEVDLNQRPTYENPSTAKFKDANVVGNELIINNGADKLYIVDENLVFKKEFKLQSSESPSSFLIHQSENAGLDVLYGSEHLEIVNGRLSKVERFSQITFIKKTINFRGRSVGVNHAQVFFFRPATEIFNSGAVRIFDIYNYRDSLILATTKNDLLLHAVDKQVTKSFKAPIKIFKIVKGKYHCIIQAHSGALHFCTDILDNNTYRKIAGLPADLVVRDIISVNDSMHIVLGQNTTVLLQDGKDDVRVSYLGARFLPKDVVNAFSKAQNLYILSRKAISKVPYQDLLTPCRLPYFADVVVYNQNFNTDNSSIEVEKDAGSINVRYDVINLEQYPCFVRYKYEESDWARLTSGLLSIPNLRHGASEITIQLCGLGGAVISEKKINIYRKLPFWKTNWFIALAVLSGILLMFFGIRAYYKARNKKKLQVQLTKFESLQNELKALNAMMNPHFVFNSLANIQAMYRMNEVSLADQYLNDFSALIRQNMRNVQQELIPLSAELEIVRGYLGLENLRFNNTLHWQINLHDTVDAEELLIPPLLLQPIAENSIKHGLFRKKGVDNKIKIEVNKLPNESISIKVMDNGIGIEASMQNSLQESEGNKLALKNIRQRIEHLNLLRNMNATLSLSQEGEWHIVQITL